MIDALSHERTEARTNHRNGTCEEFVTTGVRDVNVKIPKTPHRVVLSALPAPRRRIDVALHAVIMQAYIERVSTPRVDDLVTAQLDIATGVSADADNRHREVLGCAVGDSETEVIGGDSSVTCAAEA